jgi:FlaA1/EpsC-like NDP-sugar epimerase
VDLARDLIRLSGFGEQDIRIEFTGLRAGEKLYEELLADSEQTLQTPHPKLRIAKTNTHPNTAWRDDLALWLEEPASPSDDLVRARLKVLVPEYVPPNAGTNTPPG